MINNVSLKEVLDGKRPNLHRLLSLIIFSEYAKVIAQAAA
jgi:hypothetical protein